MAGVSFVVHLFFVAFTVIGGFLAWLAPFLFLPHVAAAAWGGRMALTDAACPLSRAENWARAGAGREALDERGFIAHYFENRIYPAAWARRVEAGVAGLIACSWLGYVIL